MRVDSTVTIGNKVFVIVVVLTVHTGRVGCGAPIEVLRFVSAVSASAGISLKQSAVLGAETKLMFLQVYLHACSIKLHRA